jgi:hypothetical protein
MNSKIRFRLRQLGSKFLVFARALLLNNSRLLQAQNLRRILAKIQIFEFIYV